MEIKKKWNQLEENHGEIEINANEDSIIDCLIPINNSIIIEPFETSGDPFALWIWSAFFKKDILSKIEKNRANLWLFFFFQVISNE